MEGIVNKVAASGLITLDPADLLPAEEPVVFDLKPFLFRELILREKDYREALKTFEWEAYKGKAVSLLCSADAIIPMWAYMLAAAYLEPYASDIGFGDAGRMTVKMTLRKVEAMDAAAFAGQRVVIKGCGDRQVPVEAYIALMKKLRPVVKSIMFGEPCSTVPVYKQK